MGSNHESNRGSGPLRDRRVRRLLCACFGAGLGLLAMEVGLRALAWFEAPPLRIHFAAKAVLSDLEESEDLFWCFKEAEGFNSYRLRGYEPSSTAGERDYRILCVGDSLTFGWGLSFEDAWGLKLERSLQAAFPGVRIETLLGAIPGYSSHQSRALFARIAPRFRPDLVIFCLGAWNDHTRAASLSDSVFAAARNARWNLERLGARALRELRRSLAGPEGSQVADTELRVPPFEFRANLRALFQAARSAGAEVLILLPPAASFLELRFPNTLRYRELAREEARDAELVIIDGAAALQRRSRARGRTVDTLFFSDGVHPNAEGQAFLAEAVLETMHACGLASRIASRCAADPSTGELAIRWIEGEPYDPRLRIELADLGIAGDLRVWSSGRFLGPFSTDRAGGLELTPWFLEAGTHRLELISRAGRRTTGSFDWPGLPLHVDAEIDGDGVMVRAHGFAPPAAEVHIVVEPAQDGAGPPETSWGRLWSERRSEAPLADIARQPSQDGALPPPLLHARAQANGRWAAEQFLRGFSPGNRRFAFQGIVVKGRQATLTECVIVP